MPRWSTVVLPSLLLAGCTHVRLSDPSFEIPAAELGEASATLVTAPPGADPAALERVTRTIEESLVDLALTHDACGVGDETLPAFTPLHATADGLTWNGARLHGALVDDDALLVANLRYIGPRTLSVLDGDDPGGTCPTGEADGSGLTIECDPFIDRTLQLERTVQVDGAPARLRLDADYGLVLDGDGCAAGGQVEITYALLPEAGAPRGGFVSAQYHGCDRIQVFTRE